MSELQAEITRFKRAASDEIAMRLDHEGRRSAEVGNFKLKVNAPLERAWDVEKLIETLDRFVEQGEISREKADRCIRNKPEVAAREINNLLSDPRTAPEVSLCFTDVKANRYVTVEEK